ncbi:MAG TPA: CHAT domain-containing protein [Thermoanaerobaculia bacterium]|nr:CHAT domain-containing protein [Thermoanaerobaculia bacterium]
MRDFYLDFDLSIERSTEGYESRVVSSPGGVAVSTFVSPFSEMELENFRLRVSRRRSGVRRAATREVEVARGVGEKLFRAALGGDVQHCLQASLNEASRRGAGLRLRLTGTADLGELPWEYLYSPDLDRFVSLSSETPVLRYVKPTRPMRPLAVSGCLRLLAVMANPPDYPPLDIDREWENLRQALSDLEHRGLLMTKHLTKGTLSALQKELRQCDYHIIHFIGHGFFDEHEGNGMLVFEEGSGRGRPVSGNELGTLLHDHPSLRLVVLNACEGARAARADPLAGAALSLVRQQIPAVVAMQYEISDAAAVTFAREFYGAIADAYPVDAAVSEARKAMFAEGHGVEWGTPVLYSRSVDGHLFERVHPVGEQCSAAPEAEWVVDGASSGQRPLPDSDEDSSGPVTLMPRAQPTTTEGVEPGFRFRLWRSRLAPTLLLAFVFLANLLETYLDSHLPSSRARLALKTVSTMHWLEGHFTFVNHDATNVVALYGYSSVYFFIFPLLCVAVAVELMLRADRRPYRTFSVALAVDYLISLPFFLLFPVPERWTDTESGAMLLSDLWTSNLIAKFRPMSAIDNCFPSFHTSMTVVAVILCYLYRVRLRTMMAALGFTVILSTFVLGIHWAADIVAGIAVGVISVVVARRCVDPEAVGLQRQPAARRLPSSRDQQAGTATRTAR